MGNYCFKKKVPSLRGQTRMVGKSTPFTREGAGATE